jgi:TonB family protein
MSRAHGMQLLGTTLVLLAGTLALGTVSSPLCAQSSPELELLATQTAETVTKTHPQRVLVATLDGCLMDVQICAAYDGALRASLAMSLPAIQFVNRDEVASLVKKRGFLGIDVYSIVVLQEMAPETGAEILLTENLGWVSDGYELTGEAFDVRTDKSHDKFTAKVARSRPGAGDEPTVVKDLETGISLITWTQKKAKFPVFRYPECERCLNPQYTKEARKKRLKGKMFLVATVTEQGVLQDVHVVKGLDPEFDSAVVDSVRAWLFKPAVGFDGKLFAVRIPIELRFKIF